MPSFNFFLAAVSEIHRSKFFFGAVSEIQRSKVFSVFQIWLPHNVTYDVIIIIETVYVSRRSNGENFISIGQAVTEKNTKVLCGQTDRQTDQRSFGNKRILAKKNTKNYHGRNLEFFFFCPMLKIGLFGNFGNFM